MVRQLGNIPVYLYNLIIRLFHILYPKEHHKNICFIKNIVLSKFHNTLYEQNLLAYNIYAMFKTSKVTYIYLTINKHFSNLFK